jgi:hypothetical protein
MDGAVHHSAWPAAPAYQSLCRGGVCQRLLPDGPRLQPTLLLVFGQSSLSRRMVVPKANLGRPADWLARSWVASSAMPAMSAFGSRRRFSGCSAFHVRLPAPSALPGYPIQVNDLVLLSRGLGLIIVTDGGPRLSCNPTATSAFTAPACRARVSCPPAAQTGPPGPARRRGMTRRTPGWLPARPACPPSGAHHRP